MATTLAQVRTIQVGALTGEPGFGRKLIEALQRLDRFEFTEDRIYADAVLEADGQDQEEGFIGTVTLRDLRGTILWTGRALRPHGVAGPMAYERIVAQFKDALGATEQSRTA